MSCGGWDDRAYSGGQVIGVHGIAHRRTALLAGAVGLLAGLAAAVGVVFRGDGSWSLVTSVRGETYEMATTGVYAWNAQRVVAEGIGWDLFTLLVAVPLMLLCVPFVARGSFHARMLALGLFGYFLYQYLEYAVTWALGPLFPLFVLVFAGSLMGIIAVATDLAAEHRSGTAVWTFGDRFPRLGWAVVSLTMCVLLALMWVGRLAQTQATGIDGILMGQTTLTVQALDLGLVVPLVSLSAVLAWRGSQVGRYLAAATVVMFVAMAAAITSMLLSAWAVEGTLEAPPVVIFGVATAAALIVGVRMYRRPSLVAEVTQAAGAATGSSAAGSERAARNPSMLGS
jgi:hypothetical protein